MRLRGFAIGLLLATSVTIYFPGLIRSARAGDAPDPPPPPKWDGPWNAYLYTLPIDEEPTEKSDPDPSPAPGNPDACYITFYDIAGYVPGSAQGPTGWVATAQNTGFTPPGASVTDDPSLVNLTFEYSSGPDLVGPNSLGDFDFDSIYPDTAPGQFAGQDMNANTDQFETSQEIDMLPAVPEPGSLMLAGAGAMILGRRRRGRGN